MYRNHLAVLLLTVILMVSSCATTRMYEGPELPRDKVAFLKPDIGFGMFRDTATIATIDGQAPGFSNMRMAVLPGKHTLEIQASSSYGVYGLTASGVLSFEAEAGHTYIARGRVVEEGYGAHVWLEDADTHEVVAGQKP